MNIDTTLPLNEGFNRSPQVGQLLKLFQNDVSLLKNYAHDLLKNCSNVANIYNEVMLANQQLSNCFKEFQNLKFSIDNGSKVIGEFFVNFGLQLDELSSHCHLMSSQLSDSVIHPLTQLIEGDLKETEFLEEHYVSANYYHDEALSKYMKLSKKRDSMDERAREMASQEVYTARKKLVKASLHYYSKLNLLQSKRTVSLLETGLNYLTAQKLFAASTHESFASSGIEDLIQAILSTTGKVADSVKEEQASSMSTISILDDDMDLSCYPEPINELQRVADRSLSSKSGYLFQRNRSLLMTHWSRCYITIQSPSSHLMIQHNGETAASAVMDLADGEVFARSADIDDRRWVFEVISKKLKKHIYFQAENQLDRDEWIAVISSITGSPVPAEPLSPNTSHPATPDRNSSLLSHIRRSLVEGSPSKSNSETPVEESLEKLSLLNVPIQFDLSSPTEEFPPLPKWLNPNVSTSPTNRVNPFGERETGEKTSESLSQASDVQTTISHTYSLRFVGSVRHLKPDLGKDVSDQLVCDTMQQILAARAIHGIFRMSEVNLLVAADGVFILDLTNSSVKARFPIHHIVHTGTHKENEHLFGFVTASVESPADITCHVFECDVNAKEIVDVINLLKQISQEVGATAITSSITEEKNLTEQVSKLQDREPESEETKDE